MSGVASLAPTVPDDLATLAALDISIVIIVILLVLLVGIIASLQANGVGIAFLEGFAPWLVPAPGYDYASKNEYEVSRLSQSESNAPRSLASNNFNFDSSNSLANHNLGTAKIPSTLSAVSNIRSRASSISSNYSSSADPWSVARETINRSHYAGGASRHREGSTTYHQQNTSFFLADKAMKFWFVGSSLFASNIGSEHFVGQAGDGARRGLGVAMFEWYACILLVALGWMFAPIYRRLGIYTTPEFFDYRFGRLTRHYLSFITCIMYVVSKMSASIYGGAVVLENAIGWDLYWSAGICILLSTIYTITGGLRAVMYTDLLQTFVFVLGGLIVLAVALTEVGGPQGINDKLVARNRTDMWHLFKPADDDDYPWTGIFFGQPFTSLWYWCLDQDIVQRALAASDDVQCKAGCTSAALLKLLPPFIMVIPGIIAFLLYEDEVVKDTDKAYSVLLNRMMPTGVKGLMVASIITAMMSSLDSVFNAGSNIITNDVYRVLYPKASADTLLYVGRVSTVAFALLSFAWIPVFLASDFGLFRTISEIQGLLTPPIGVVLLLGVTNRRVNGAGALSGLIVGTFMGALRLVIVVVLKGGAEYDKSTVVGSMLDLYFGMAFLHFSILLWTTTLVVTVVVSYCTPKPQEGVEAFMINWSEVFARNVASDAYPRWVHRLLLGSISAILFIALVLCIVFS